MRGIDLSYETVRCWTIKFGPQIANEPTTQTSASDHADGTSTRCSHRSAGNLSGAGGLSTMKARCSIWSSKNAEIQGLL